MNTSSKSENLNKDQKDENPDKKINEIPDPNEIPSEMPDTNNTPDEMPKSEEQNNLIQ